MAEDVKYSLQRILDPRERLFGAAGLATIDPRNIQIMDPQTVRLLLTAGDSTIGEQLGQYYNGIVPLGYSRRGPLKWIGTGPFVTQSFTPGQQSVHTRNKNYWRTAQPYFDQVTVIDFPEATGQVNALLSGQLDAITDIPFAQINVAKSNRGLGLLITPGGGWLPLCMAIDMPPFDDNRVRQAMRLIVDRNAMLEQVLSGYGHIANDLFSPFDACYDDSLPQREQDIEKAKSLLNAAGMAGAKIDLHTTNGAAGMVDSANVFASQAQAAGITVNVHNDPNYYGTPYPKPAFSVDFWGTAQLPAPGRTACCPRRRRSRRPTTRRTGRRRRASGSTSSACTSRPGPRSTPPSAADLIHEMQMQEYTNGGYIIPFFNGPDRRLLRPRCRG